MALRMFTLGLVSAIASLAGGCGASPTHVERGNREQILHLSSGSDPSSLDPQLVTGISERYILLALMEGLVTRDPETLAVEPAVAESWTVSDDGLTYRFDLDPEARWSNGDRVTADHFVFAYRRMLSPEFGAPYAYMLYSMKNARAFHKGELTDFSRVGVRAVDPGTLEIELERPTPYFLDLLAHESWWPVHPPTILEHGAMTDRVSDWTRPENFVGNGPFTLDEWQLNRRIAVSANPKYREAEQIRLRGIRFYPLSGDTEERAFRAGYIHLSYSAPTHRADWYRRNRPDQIRFDTFLGTYYYAFNVDRPPLDDRRVRRALALSIDREALTRHILRAGQKPARHFTPPGAGRGYAPDARMPYDPERARRLLAEAGYPGGEGFPELTLLYNTKDDHRTIAVAIQQMWREELGVDISLVNQEWKVYLTSRQNGEFDIVRAGWIGDYNDPNTFLNLLSGDSGNNHTNWSHPRYNELIQKASETPDRQRRQAIFRQAESLLLREAPIVPIYFYVRSLLIDEAVRGWPPNLLDYHPYNDVYLEPEGP